MASSIAATTSSEAVLDFMAMGLVLLFRGERLPDVVVNA
jgi:hypothetical protein